MGVILEDDQIFVCPQCGSSRWGSTTSSDDSLKRYCKGKLCDFTWHESEDINYVYQKSVASARGRMGDDMPYSVTRNDIILISQTNSIVHRAIEMCTFNNHTNWETALMIAVKAMDDESKRLTKALEISEQYKPQMQLICNLGDLPDKERAIILDALSKAKND